MLAIIGGTGLYRLDQLERRDLFEEITPFGKPSGPVLRGQCHGRDVLFLARHGEQHQLLPHEINYRANVFALKRAGATSVIGFSAVGSLVERVTPGSFALPQQYIDWTAGRRAHTFFGDGVAAHVSTATPVCTRLVGAITAAAGKIDHPVHTELTYVCVEGPRLGTQAESHCLRNLGCHLVGMTNVPEVFLAREAQLPYATVGLVTDYDSWHVDPAQHVNAASIFEQYRHTLDKAKLLLDELLRHPPPDPDPGVRNALQSALLTPATALTEQQRDWFEILRR